MQPSLVVATLLCFTTWMSSVHAAPLSVKSCCAGWSTTRIPLDRIVNYTIQSEDNCRIKAVQLRTILGKTICANPDAVWTKNAIEKVNKENLQEENQNDEGSDMTPTGSTPALSTPVASTAGGQGIKVNKENCTNDEGSANLTMFCQITLVYKSLEYDASQQPASQQK